MKKFLAVVFTVFFGVMIFPNLSQAATLSEIKAQVAELSRQIAKLQKAEVASSSGAAAQRPKITVVSPNGGESFTAGGNMEINFESTDGEVDLFLLPQNRKITTLVGSGKSNFGWTIPSNIGSAENYRIKASLYQKIGKIRRLKATDVSDKTFSIVAASGGGSGGGGGGGFVASNIFVAADYSINLTYKQGDTNVKVGSFVLSLSATSTEGVDITNMKFDFFGGGNFQNLRARIGTTPIGLTMSFSAGTITGTPLFSIPPGVSKTVDLYADVLTNAVVGTGPFSVLVSCEGSGSLTKNSLICVPQNLGGQTITITPGSFITPSITVLSPNGGEKFRYGENITVNWTSQNIPSSASVQIVARNYLKDGSTGENYVLANYNNTLNDGTETVRSGDVLNGGFLPIGVYLLNIRYTDKDNWVYQDWSDDYFIILPGDKG